MSSFNRNRMSIQTKYNIKQILGVKYLFHFVNHEQNVHIFIDTTINQAT